MSSDTGIAGAEQQLRDLRDADNDVDNDQPLNICSSSVIIKEHHVLQQQRINPETPEFIPALTTRTQVNSDVMGELAALKDMHDVCVN